jgi:putative flippase GtrA
MSYIIYAGLLYFALGEKYYQISLALAWVISSVISFTTQKNLVFCSKGNVFNQYAKCCITWFFSYLLNAFLLWLLVQKLLINPYLGQIVAIGFCAVFNYLLFKTFAFRKQ